MARIKALLVAFAAVVLVMANGSQGSISDANGSAAGCSSAYPGTSVYPVTAVQVCLDLSGGDVCRAKVTIT
ncbi:hypothetical protein F4553_007300 [Allocatelliglobosispora scoriae]|uniref:Uncharacterized protein n=1 Tax=Allocatelliglobosispora scoriae TaxID=643052 RepID=A0A841C1W4_9ACTN|nr:hypothetical protein [Allocatelliglobosispora scoriae]MBB5873866.1 hypothetical protein [Allocatelliglobosispora scoriae]